MEIPPLSEPGTETLTANKRIRQTAWIVIIVILTFLIGVGSGYLKWGRSGTSTDKDLDKIYRQINPQEGYALPVSYGDLGPRLIEGGAIDYPAFAAVYNRSGASLSQEQIDILKSGSDAPIVINADNAHFLLNFFWAVGLANRNSILTEGPMVQKSDGHVEGFASTGGWTLASEPITDLYASMDLIPLTAEQQQRVEQVAAGIYRPCCDNPTLFPDCNHGMAMLGLLELMASQGASTDQMFRAAKYVNAYWFPQQALEIAIYLQSSRGTDFADAEPRLVVGKSLSSSSGAQMVHQALLANGLLEQAPGQGGSCSN